MRTSLFCMVFGLGLLFVVGVISRPNLLGQRIAREVESASATPTNIPVGTIVVTGTGKPVSSSSSPLSFVPRPRVPAPSSTTNATVITLVVCFAVAIVVAAAATLVTRWYRKRKRLPDKKPEIVEEGAIEDDDDDSDEEDIDSENEPKTVDLPTA